jgi:hypothetical protein
LFFGPDFDTDLWIALVDRTMNQRIRCKFIEGEAYSQTLAFRTSELRTESLRLGSRIRNGCESWPNLTDHPHHLLPHNILIGTSAATFTPQHAPASHRPARYSHAAMKITLLWRVRDNGRSGFPLRS